MNEESVVVTKRDLKTLVILAAVACAVSDEYIPDLRREAWKIQEKHENALGVDSFADDRFDFLNDEIG